MAEEPEAALQRFEAEQITAELSGDQAYLKILSPAGKLLLVHMHQTVLHRFFSRAGKVQTKLREIHPNEPIDC